MSQLITPKGTKREERTELNTGTPARQHANDLVKEAGGLVGDFGSKYLGSAVVHFYANPKIIGVHQWQTVCQLTLGPVPEGLADYGHKELRRALMKSYGKEERERT